MLSDNFRKSDCEGVGIMKPNEKLRHLINESGLTVTESAKQIGVSRRTLHQWLNGELPRMQIAIGAMDKIKDSK